MKPDWEDAPEWANYHTKDANGACWWWGHTPVVHKDGKIWDCAEIYGDTQVEPAAVDGDNDGTLTLDTRP